MVLHIFNATLLYALSVDDKANVERDRLSVAYHRRSHGELSRKTLAARPLLAGDQTEQSQALRELRMQARTRKASRSRSFV